LKNGSGGFDHAQWIHSFILQNGGGDLTMRSRFIHFFCKMAAEI